MTLLDATHEHVEITQSDAARILDVSLPTARKFVRAGELGPVRVTRMGRVRLRLRDVFEAAAERQGGPPASTNEAR